MLLPPTLSPNQTTSTFLRMLVILYMFNQSFNMVLKWIFYLGEIRYDQLLASYVLYPGDYQDRK